MDPKKMRRRLLVDPAFQFRLLARMVFYFVVYIVFAFHVAFLFHVLATFATDGLVKDLGTLYGEFLFQQQTLLLALILIAPILLYDLLKFSHRVAGPLFRCRRVMREMAAGQAVPLFVPRKHDLMRELFNDFNQLIARWNTEVNANQVDSMEPASPAQENGVHKQPSERADKSHPVTI